MVIISIALTRQLGQGNDELLLGCTASVMGGVNEEVDSGSVGKTTTPERGFVHPANRWISKNELDINRYTNLRDFKNSILIGKRHKRFGLQFGPKDGVPYGEILHQGLFLRKLDV
jgi:hypothetical protein